MVTRSPYNTPRRVPTRKVVVRSTGRKIIEQSRLRLLCVALFFVLCFGSIGVRLLEMMVLSYQQPNAIIVSDIDTNTEESAPYQVSTDRHIHRGDIVDRNGVLLATSLATASVFVNPREIRNPEYVAAKLEKRLPGSGGRQALLAKLKSNKSFVWIRRNLTPSEQQAVNSLGIPGLYFLPEQRRVYPYGNMLAHILGYVGLDNKGLAGIEKYFDARLQDAAINDEVLTLSVDMRVQSIMYDELQAAMDEFHAIGGAGVVMDIESGELLSMVSLPDFDPHRPGAARDDAKFNRVSLGTYEMGSTFKSFTMAMALDGGVASMRDKYDATGPFTLASFTVQDQHSKGRWLTVPEIYAFSSNVGTARMILQVGSKRQQKFLGNIGMFAPLDIELPERGVPQYPKDWKQINMVTISYGHGISVTPLHLVRAIATLANGGTLSPVTLVKGGSNGKSKGTRVISEQTSQQMLRLMRLVVEHGTATHADVKGYRVGGKTGTAEKISASGGYNEHNNMASFISVFPVDAPRYVVLVMVDEPRGNKETFGNATGGWVAAPVVGRVISRMAPVLGIPPVYNAPGDDADKFWVEAPKPKILPAATPPSVQPNVEPQLLHAIAY